MPVEGATELWGAWASGRLCLQTCISCGELQHPPGPVCSHCHGLALSLVEIDGRATLVSWSTVYRAPAIQFSVDIPYTIAIVRVGNTALVEARVDGSIELSGFRVGMPVQLAIKEILGVSMPVVVLI
jgi:uncharacterized protein